METAMFVRSIFCLVLVFFHAAASAGPERLQAGLRMLTVPASINIPVALYYPTKATAQPVAMGPWMVTVASGAEPEASLKGLLLLSHGTGGSEFNHHNLARRLAQEGYLVAAVRHPRDNWQDRSLVASEAFFSERPQHISQVLDALLADKEWIARLPAGRIGAIGHSAGGYTVLALAGGMADVQRVAAHCATAADDPGFCRLGGKHAGQGPSRLPPETFDVMDRRIRAVAALAPIGVVFTPASLARIDVPMTIYTAEKDDVLAGVHHGQRLRAALPQASFEEVQGAGHFAFLAPSRQPLQSVAGDTSVDPPGFDRALFLQRLESELTDFFDRHLR